MVIFHSYVSLLEGICGWLASYTPQFSMAMLYEQKCLPLNFRGIQVGLETCIEPRQVRAFFRRSPMRKSWGISSKTETLRTGTWWETTATVVSTGSFLWCDSWLRWFCWLIFAMKKPNAGMVHGPREFRSKFRCQLLSRAGRLDLAIHLVSKEMGLVEPGEWCDLPGLVKL